MAENNIIIYSVAVEPNLGSYKNGRGFFKGIAQQTHGRYLSLGQAQLLPDVIVGGSAEELDLKKIENDVETAVVEAKTERPDLSAADLEVEVHSRLKTKGVRTWHLDVTHQDEHVENEAIFTECDSLSKANEKISSASPMSFLSPSSTTASASSSSSMFSGILPSIAMPTFLTNMFSSSSAASAAVASNPLYVGSSDESVNPLMDGGYSRSSAPREYSSQSARVYQDDISKDQIHKVMSKNHYS